MAANDTNHIVDSFPRNSTELVCVGTSNYQGRNLVFVRLFAKVRGGAPLATRYGVSLPLEKREALMSAVHALGEMMKPDGEAARIQKNEREQVRVRLTPYQGRTLIDIRIFAPIGPLGEYAPTKDGIALNLDFFARLMQAMEKLAEAQPLAPIESEPALEHPTPLPQARAEPMLQGVEVTQLSPKIAEDLYVDESGFLIHPHLLDSDEPRKTRDERWAGICAPSRVQRRPAEPRSGNVFQRIAAGANRIRVGGGPQHTPTVFPVAHQHRTFNDGSLKCPLCEHRTEYKIMYDHILICHPTNNAKLVMAALNRELRNHRE